MDNANRFAKNRSRTVSNPPTAHAAFAKDEPRPHKPGVRLTADQMRRFKIALAQREEKIQDALERLVEEYIAETESNG